MEEAAARLRHATRPFMLRRTKAEVAAERVPDAQQVRGRTIIVVDKPGAAQSVVQLGRIGVPRSTDDYYALEVMNVILGGSFTSRLNQNLREDKGYSYGARSAFDYQLAAGPWSAGASVQTQSTGPAIAEFMNELRGMHQPIPADEVERAKNFLAMRYPAGFQSAAGIAARIADLVEYGLPMDYFGRYVDGIISFFTNLILTIPFYAVLLVFGQALLAFKDRYFLTLGMRVDGNSAFGEDLGLQTYPKISGSYVISDEDFWNPSLGVLKLRAAYGQSGRAPGTFDAVRTWEALGYGNWAIRETATGDYVGSVGVLDYRRILEPAFDAPELGWGVAPRFQGRGMAFEALSAFGTVGLSMGVTGELTGGGKLILAVLMFVGRLGPLTLALGIAASSA